MKEKYFTKEMNYKKILRKIMVESLKITGAIESFVLYGTNETQKKHLPIEEWDRAVVYGITGKTLFGLVAKIKVFVAKIKKLVPVMNYIIKDGKKIENFGVIPYLFNRFHSLHKKGITVLLVPEVKKYVEDYNQEYAKIPIYSYDGHNLKRLNEDVRVIVGIIKIGNSRNFVSLQIPHFGIMELNNINQQLLAKGNEENLKIMLNRLISMVNVASLAYYHQKGKYISETQRMEDLLHKEELLRDLSATIRRKENEITRKTEVLNKVMREKFDLELQRNKLSKEVLKAIETVKDIRHETDTSLATISHTSKNLYIAQKSLTGFVNKNIASIENELVLLKKTIQAVTNRYPKIGEYQFWKNIRILANRMAVHYENLGFNHKRSSDHMNQVMDYILAVISHQRGTDYIAEGDYYSDLIKILDRIRKTHRERLDNLGISFEYMNNTGDKTVLIDKIYHFHLEEDIFINLLINSIQALQGKPKKRIWIEIYSSPPANGESRFYEIHYRDNGCGIPADKKSVILTGWTSKQQYNLTEIDSKTEHGLGGKTILKRIQNAGGTIKEIGIEGEGAHFVITLAKHIDKKAKIKLSSQNEPEAEKIEFPWNTKKHILIIDDDKSVQHYIADIFQETLIPSFATGQEEAWNRIYSTHPPDIITLDLDLLSAEKGENLLFNFHMKGITRKIPIVIVSGADRAYEEEKLQKLGAAAIFQKPIKIDTLREKVFNLLTTFHQKKS
ncbi:MAG: response regulator [Spirochaetales bacterium]|nr:response regulator [Spirochaetales bacterium]